MRDYRTSGVPADNPDRLFHLFVTASTSTKNNINNESTSNNNNSIIETKTSNVENEKTRRRKFAT